MADAPTFDQADNDPGRPAAPDLRGSPGPMRDRPGDTSSSSEVMNAAAELNLPDLLRGIVRSCCHLVGAGYGVLTVMGPDREAIEVGYAGVDTWARPHHATAVPAATPVRLATQLTPLPDDHLHQPSPRLFVNIPVRRSGDLIGHLGLGAKHDQTGFNDEDETVAISLAAVAGNAVELAATVQQHQRHLVLIGGPNDPDAIIRDLFSLGLELHKLTSTLISADDRANMSSTVDTIDQAIRQIRTVAFTPW